MDVPQPQALVIGRLGADLYPLQSNTPLEEVRTFERFVGGFAGNVATGLARLGVRTAIVSAVGDDGHGRFIRRFLADEGVDLRWLGTHPTLRTALAFCEAWPPDHFPITFYREPTCPDWELTVEALPRGLLRQSPLADVTGTGLAREPSRATTLAALELRASSAAARWTIFDLDWRPQLWHVEDGYPPLAERAARSCNVLIGGDAEFAAADIEPAAAVHDLGTQLAVVKHGAQGVSVHSVDGVEEIPGIPVPVVNGLGAGDAFAAAFGAALLAGLPAAEAARHGNAAGAIVASRLGCAPAMPTSSELRRLLDEGSLPVDEVADEVTSAR
jgi:5-dehydro-2-deoxygluconokinase